MSDLLERLRFGIKTKPPRPGEVFGEYDIADLERTGLEAAGRIEQLEQRNREHEQFRNQHRNCDQMGVELQALRRSNKELLDAFATARDAILNGRGALESVLDNDQTNAVLAELDYAFDAALSAADAKGEKTYTLDDFFRDAKRFGATAQDIVDGIKARESAADANKGKENGLPDVT